MIFLLVFARYSCFYCYYYSYNFYCYYICSCNLICYYYYCLIIWRNDCCCYNLNPLMNIYGLDNQMKIIFTIFNVNDFFNGLESIQLELRMGLYRYFYWFCLYYRNPLGYSDCQRHFIADPHILIEVLYIYPYCYLNHF